MNPVLPRLSLTRRRSLRAAAVVVGCTALCGAMTATVPAAAATRPVTATRHTAATMTRPTIDAARAAKDSASGSSGSTGTPQLQPHVKAACPWPPAARHAACLVLERTNITGHLGLFAAGSDPEGYGPSSLHSAYDLPAGSDGNGETVALVDAYDDPNAASDLATYRSQYGLPPCTTASGCFKKVNQSGVEGDYPQPDPDWAVEESLDIEMVSAICPACHILLVEASSATSGGLAASVDTAVSLGADYVSNSYGGPDGSYNSIFQKFYTHPGVAITVAAGDYGYGEEWPAGYPQVISVGGTSLLPASNPRGWDEIVWTGTGSGCAPWPKPSWQTDTGCGARRTDNDVAAIADPETGVAIYDSYGGFGGWGVVGGTSVSSPLIASVYALAGKPTAGTNPARYLYANHADLNDIVAGTSLLSGNCSPTYLCNGEVGYDGPTGWGTPDGVGSFESQPGYVAMGDSYSSGEGVPPYYSDSNTRKDQCHRSKAAYPTLVTWPGQSKPISKESGFTFIACSGAETTGITSKAVFSQNEDEKKWNAKGNTDWGYIQGEAPWDTSKDRLAEGLQDNSSKLDASTGLVTLTIGGNDARFSDVLTGCLLLAPQLKTDCISPDYKLVRNSLKTKPQDPEALIKFEPTVIGLLKAHLVATYEAIHAKAPNALIVVSGYPLLFPANATSSCTVGTVLGKKIKINAGDQKWLDSTGTLLNQTVSASVAAVEAKGIDIRFVDPTSAFSGHEICSSSPFINGLLAFYIGPGGFKLVNPGSFHPNQAGQAEYAKLVNGCLDGTVSC
jgi:hypothetical protein